MTPAALNIDPLLSILAIAISLLSAFVVIDLIHRVQASKGLPHLGWFISATFTIASSIWATNLIGTLSYQLPVAPTFDLRLIAFSAGTAVLGSFATMLATRRSKASVLRLAVGGLFLTSTIAAVHHLGLASLRIEGYLVFQPIALGAAVGLGGLAAIAGLAILTRSQQLGHRLGASILLGLSMVAIQLVDSTGAAVALGGGPPGNEDSVLSNLAIASSIAGVVFMILFMGLTAATFDRRYAEMAAEEAGKLRKARDFTAMLMDSSVDGVAAFDTDLRVTAWSPSMSKLSGVSAERMIGRHIVAAPGLRTNAIQAAAGMATINEHTTVETDVFVDEAERFWTIQVAPVIDRDGRNQGGILFVHDDTERRKLQEAVRQTQRLEAVGHMTGSVAHDFSNVLMVLNGSVELMDRHRDIDKYLPAIKTAVARGRDLTKQLLAFSRRQNLRREEIDPKAHLPGLLELMKRASSPAIELSLDIAPDTWPVITDQSELEIALLNLTVNARDAMPDGGKMTVVARNINLEEDHPSGLEGDFVEFRVVDTGTGMPPEIAAKVWEPYFTTKEVGKGSGLGLSQVYGFAKQCGGTVSIDTTPGQGTTIIIWLPRATDGVRDVAVA